MHVITGGAYNGKARWVKEHYQLEINPHIWVDVYKDSVPQDLSQFKSNIRVLDAVEGLILNELKTNHTDIDRDYGKVLIKQWAEWEKEIPERQLIIIGNDISKGIVPMSGLERIWRDLTGWFYQDLVAVSNRVDYIWYGIAKQLK